MTRESRLPVDLLRDGRGVYGIGIIEDYQHEPDKVLTPPTRLILRPDCMAAHDDGLPCPRAVLQKIAGGFRRGPFCRSVEEGLRQLIHHAALRRSGLSWPPTSPQAWWSDDPIPQAKNRATYHGLRLSSLSAINKLMGAAIEEAADHDAIRVARRFTFDLRYKIYRAGVQSLRARQLAETFPALAIYLYTCAPNERTREAVRLVEGGARLRDVAAAVDIPMTLRRVKPGAAHLVTKAFTRHGLDVLDCIPHTLPDQRIWLRAVRLAGRKNGDGYAAWCAKHISELPCGSLRGILSWLADVGDWVNACNRINAPFGYGISEYDASLGYNPPRDFESGAQFVTRAFTHGMSVSTVTELSAHWHEAVAANMSGPLCKFPAPWFPENTVGNYSFMPIDNAADLHREGATMRHCASTYAGYVRSEYAYIYSVRSAGERVATLALERTAGDKAVISQLRGHCNAEVSKEIEAAAEKWVSSQPKIPPIQPKIQHALEDDDIPF